MLKLNYVAAYAPVLLILSSCNIQGNTPESTIAQSIQPSAKVELSVAQDLFNRRIDDILDHDAHKVKSPEQVHQENLAHLRQFVAAEQDTPYDDIHVATGNLKADNLKPSIGASVLMEAMYHPVVSSGFNYIYDPKNLGIGFCFGRAMFVNLELAYRGLDRDSIKKAFVIGPMVTGEVNWGWHVTTIARSLNQSGQEQWIAIDPVIGQVVTIEKWYETMLKDYSTDKMLKLYITDAGKFGATPGGYTESEFENKFYNSYFEDLLKWYADNSDAPRYQNPINEYRKEDAKTGAKIDRSGAAPRLDTDIIADSLKQDAETIDELLAAMGKGLLPPAAVEGEDEKEEATGS